MTRKVPIIICAALGAALLFGWIAWSKAGHFYAADGICKSPAGSACTVNTGNWYLTLSDHSHFLDARARSIGPYPVEIRVYLRRRKSDASVIDEEIVFCPFVGARHSALLGKIHMRHSFSADSGLIRIDLPDTGYTLSMRKLW